MISVEKLQEHGDYLATCCLVHNDGWRDAIVAHVLFAANSDCDCGGNYGPDVCAYPTCRERDGFAVFRTDTGRIAVLLDGEDYTGHGCQCSSSLSVFDNLDDALKLGLTSPQRAAFSEGTI